MKKTIDLNIKTNLAGKLHDFLEQFLEYLRYQKSFSEKTIEAYYLDISQFITYLETDNNNLSIEKIDHNIIKAFLWDLKNSGFNNNSDGIVLFESQNAEIFSNEIQNDGYASMTPL